MKLLRPQKKYTWILILFALFFVGFGLWSLHRFHTVSAWPLVVTGVLLMLILLLWWLPNSSYLVLTATGLHIRYLFQTSAYAWSQVQNIWISRSLTGQKRVYYMLAGTSLMRVRYLPDNYGLEPRELAHLLNQWRQQPVAEPLEPEQDLSPAAESSIPAFLSSRG